MGAEPDGGHPRGQFFADLPVDIELDRDQQRALDDIRAALERVRPRYVRPEDTHGSFSDYYELELVIRHAEDPEVQIELHFGDGYLSLRWPGGWEHDGWEWRPYLAGVIEALLSGRNRQTLHTRLGRVIAVETEIWDETGRRKRLRVHRRWRELRVALLPIPIGRQRRSISFDRAPAVGPPE